MATPGFRYSRANLLTLKILIFLIRLKDSNLGHIYLFLTIRWKVLTYTQIRIRRIHILHQFILSNEKEKCVYLFKDESSLNSSLC